MWALVTGVQTCALPIGVDMIEPRLGEAHCDPETAVRPGLLGMLVHKGRETAVGRQQVKLLRQFLVEPCNGLTRRLAGKQDHQRSDERRVGKEGASTRRSRRSP